jgi:hypothetical protein
MRKSQWNPYAAENAWGENVDVRFGSKADIFGDLRDVRFSPESGHPACALIRNKNTLVTLGVR